ncbi:FGGY family carbohydrate kinase [Bifidobacterium amazonense]|uniref:FGGY family carbohydrate kinase n=1 Tax=Bifidobacterium amazonense TaxID=2809027 RepID=A0ABS9VRC4_9BIFI|nr:FGGY family carbohydrate kinase [Bifidobacterium amazonense]MCH9274693.1 FGGY family carbohydrate kinase [Bifidobacterium amazonense]
MARGYAATFDMGTTAVKGALVDDDGRIAASASDDLDLIVDGDAREQDPDQWWSAFRDVARAMLRDAAQSDPDFRADLIRGIICSGQMQDVIALDDDLRPVRNAILYSDGRAGEQAERLARAIAVDHASAGRRDDGLGDDPADGCGSEEGARRFLAVVGNRLEGCLPLPKLMWLCDREPDVFARTRHVLISSKDYAVARLTGACIGDVAACSTAGAMDIHTGRWDAGLCAAAGIDMTLLPELHRPQDVVGAVTADAAQATGFTAGTPVYAGIGDAGATTLASGVARPGQYNINLGTSGWIATVSPEPFVDKPGAANLAFGVADGFVNAVPFLNAGDVHRWAAGLFADGDYGRAHELVESSVPGANGVLCLPYLVGERFPVMNPAVRGVFVGMSPATTGGDMLRAALEGVAFSIRQGMESFDEPPTSISLIGGGACETAWCRILADMLHHPVKVFANADILPAVALAALVLDRPDLTGTVVETTVYEPDPVVSLTYDGLYPRFAALYPAVAALG